MPVHIVYRRGEKAGYKWGGHGKLYSIAEYGVKGAEKLAGKQGRAAFASGYKGK